MIAALLSTLLLAAPDSTLVLTGYLFARKAEQAVKFLDLKAIERHRALEEFGARTTQPDDEKALMAAWANAGDAASRAAWIKAYTPRGACRLRTNADRSRVASGVLRHDPTNMYLQLLTKHRAALEGAEIFEAECLIEQVQRRTWIAIKAGKIIAIATEPAAPKGVSEAEVPVFIRARPKKLEDPEIKIGGGHEDLPYRHGQPGNAPVQGTMKADDHRPHTIQVWVAPGEKDAAIYVVPEKRAD